MDEEISLEELVEQYFGNIDDYFIIKEKQEQPKEPQQEQQEQEQEEEPKVYGWNSVPNPTEINSNPETTIGTAPQWQQEEQEMEEEEEDET